MKLSSRITVNISSQNVAWFAILVAFGVLTRWLPHPPNFTALFAVALFAGRVLPTPMAVAAPILGLFLGDLWLGLHDQMWIVYLSVLPLAFVGRHLPNLSGKFATWITWGLVAVSGPVVFFVLSNLGVWGFSGLYPLNSAGLVSCFVLAIPFFHNSLLATSLYLAVLEAAHLALPWLATAAAARATSSASPK